MHLPLKFIDPSKLLMVLSLVAVLMVAGTMFLPGILGLYSLVAISFSMSLMFPTIYGIALNGLSEDESKLGAAGLVMGMVGGALMPALQGLILDFGGPGYSDVSILGISEVRFSFIVPLICFIMVALYGGMTYATLSKKLKSN